MIVGNYHHLGTTRMATDARCGAIDENCRVHEAENVYVAGRSVFPSAGFANPTLTIVALALRLADHVKRVLES
jgi:choline dehydrogenase-like flavoprotein